MKRSYLTLALALFLALPGSAKAAGNEVPPAASPSANPFQPQIVSAAQELAKEVNREQALALAQIRTGFGMVRAVRLVEADVGKAVEACGKNNPDMKDEIEGRFKTWSGSVNPLLKKSGKEMDEAIEAAAFPDKKKVKAYLDLIDKAAEYADSKIEKTPLTTPEACTGLLESMNSTEPTMVELLQSIVWTPPSAAAEPDAGAEAGKKE